MGYTRRKSNNYRKSKKNRQRRRRRGGANNETQLAQTLTGGIDLGGVKAVGKLMNIPS